MFLIAAVALANLAAPNLAQQDPPRFPGVPEQDARHYWVQLHMDFAKQELTGEVHYTFTAVEELATIRLDAQRSKDWHVTFRDSKNTVNLTSTWGESHVVVTLPKPAAKGTDVHFMATLQGKPVDGFYFKKNRYGDLMAFTDHYSIRARGWLPCEDHPGDRAKFTLIMTYPEAYEAVGYGWHAGALSGRITQEGMRSQALTSTAEIPPYMLALVVGPLTRVPETGHQRLNDHLVYKQDVDKAKRELVNHGAWIKAMEKAFGEYPYSKYMTVQCPTRWGGFEAPGNVQLAEGLFDAPGRGQGTLAHELVHMWFGDAVGYSEWREVWLSEGFASYFGPWLHAQTGGPKLSVSMQNLRDRWRKSFEGRTKSIRDDRFPHPDQALNSNTYPKGAWVLHMLRGEVGDEAFFAALRTYVDQCRGSSVITEDFVRIIERETKAELSWFFAQWLDGIGCPELKVASTDGAITIEQVQQGTPYKFWLRLRWQDDAGKSVVKRVRVDAATLRLPIEGTCNDLQIDPDTELLFRVAK
ncbi:MAG: aminopeptidase N [Planctomycetota bacterium]|jgi:aminopeptidase N